MSTFAGSTIIEDLTRVTERTDAALRAELLDAALRRHWLARVENAGGLDKAAVAAARVLAAGACRSEGGLDVVGSLSRWAARAGYERTALPEAIRRLEAARLVEILTWREGGPNAIHLALVFRPEHYQQAERDANERRTLALTQ